MKIAIVGAGAYGTALAINFLKGGHQVTLMPRRIEHAQQLNAQRVNHDYLPNVHIPEDIKIHTDLACFSAAEVVFYCCPAQKLDETHTKTLQAHAENNLPPIIICAKGIHVKNCQLLTAGFKQQNRILVQSGPHFAHEVAAGLPSAVTLACKDIALAERLAAGLSTENFKLYFDDDVVGVQISGAVKNIIAIATGISMGLGMGQNTIAALITRGLAEIRRLGLKMGARQETFLGLSGVGDLVLTCSSRDSRNTSLGAALAQGHSLEAIISGRKSVAEGVFTSIAIRKLMDQYAVRMPISRAIYNILHENRAVESELKNLLNSSHHNERD